MRPITAQVREKLSQRIQAVESQFPKGLAGIVLFGSHARNQATIRSDVDLACIFTTAEAQQREDKPLLMGLFEDTFRYLDIDLFCTTVDKLLHTEKKNDANYWIREEGDVIWKATRI